MEQNIGESKKRFLYVAVFTALLSMALSICNYFIISPFLILIFCDYKQRFHEYSGNYHLR